MHYHTNKYIKQIHKYNLYKSLNTFVWESEESETTPKKWISESTFSNQLLTLKGSLVFIESAHWADSI